MDFKEIAEENRILEIRVGSHLFGTDTEDSDLDLFGIFMPSEALALGFQTCNEVDLSTLVKDDTGRNTKDAIDRKFHEYRKFCKLAMQNNPNILHVLFADNKNIMFCDSFGSVLLDNWALFPHKGAHNRFVRYADSQRHKMRIKPANYAALENGLRILDIYMDEEDSSRLVMADVVSGLAWGKEYTTFIDSGKGKHVQCGDLHFERGTFIKKARKMIKERLSKATSRAVLFTKFGLDTKYASNLIQLLMEGIELMNTGRIHMPLIYAPAILDIKQGKYSAEEIDKWADDLVEDARVAKDKSDLPEEPDGNKIEEMVIKEVKRFLMDCQNGGV